MKRVLLALVAVTLIGCASLHWPRLADGSLDVRTLVTWGETGVELDCQWQPTAAFCIFGRDAVADVRAAMNNNPTEIQAAAKQSLRDSFVKWPVTKLWLGWLEDAL